MNRYRTMWLDSTARFMTGLRKMSTMELPD
jgi:hypothetical protein